MYACTMGWMRLMGGTRCGFTGYDCFLVPVAQQHLPQRKQNKNCKHVLMFLFFRFLRFWAAKPEAYWARDTGQGGRKARESCTEEANAEQ
jgi:hypothetical protein